MHMHGSSQHFLGSYLATILSILNLSEEVICFLIQIIISYFPNFFLLLFLYLKIYCIWEIFLKLVYFSTKLLLVYKKAVDFCMLILDPITLLKVLMRCKLVFRVFKLRMYQLQIMDPLSSFFLCNCICFLPFSCLIALAKTSSTALSKNGECGHPHFLLQLPICSYLEQIQECSFGISPLLVFKDCWFTMQNIMGYFLYLLHSYEFYFCVAGIATVLLPPLCIMYSAECLLQICLGGHELPQFRLVFESTFFPYLFQKTLHWLSLLASTYSQGLKYISWV